MTIGERIKLLRKERGLTQVQLAEFIGLERSSIGKYEGKSKSVTPSDDVKERLARFFNVSIDYLIGISDERYPTRTTALSPGEQGLLEIFRQLNSAGQSAVLASAEALLSVPAMRKEESISSMG